MLDSKKTPEEPNVATWAGVFYYGFLKKIPSQHPWTTFAVFLCFSPYLSHIFRGRPLDVHTEIGLLGMGLVLGFTLGYVLLMCYAVRMIVKILRQLALDSIAKPDSYLHRYAFILEPTKQRVESQAGDEDATKRVKRY